MEPTDLDLVAVGQGARLHPFAIHVGAVQRTDVVDCELAGARPLDARVAARHGDVVEEDLRLRMAADARDIGAQEIGTPGIRAPEDMEDRAPDGAGVIVGSSAVASPRCAASSAPSPAPHDEQNRADGSLR